MSGPLVLCYHAVSDGWEHPLSVGPAALERQLQLFLRLRYTPVTAPDAIERRGRLLHVTFDDAFRSVQAALPVLERLGVPATVFACVEYAEVPGRPLDVPELAAEVARAPGELATMGWDELRELVERGVDVQSHTLSHPHLSQLDDAELARELAESRVRLEHELGRPCKYLAYPYGDEGRRVQAAAEAAGYAAAFGLPGDSAANRYSIARVGIWRRDDLARVAVKTFEPARRAMARRQS